MNYTPKQIAELIFNSDPREKKYYNFSIYDDDEDLDTSFIFEILIEILFESFDILTDGLNNINIDEITEFMINSLDPWFNSFGFSIHAKEHNISTKFDNNYCTTIINNMLYNKIFVDKKIQNNFQNLP